MSASSLTRLQSAKQFTKQKLAVVEDKSKIVLATVNRAATKELDVAIVKATTSQFHVVPKDKHVRTLKNAVHPTRPRREVQYVILELLKRLYGATDWLTALKTLVTLHRLMRETDVTFVEELIKVSEEAGTARKGEAAAAKAGVRSAVLRMDDFIDTTNIDGRFELSEWVRAYGKYLDEQLDVYAAINFYIEQEEVGGSEGRLRGLAPKDLLFQLPKLQKLLARLADCTPKGPAVRDEVVQLSLLLVVKESFKLYKAISEGCINLVDLFFELEHVEAAKGLDIYKNFMASTDALQTYYAEVDTIAGVKQHISFPSNFRLEMPPGDFVGQMENYVKEAPRVLEEGSATYKVSPPLRRGKRTTTAKLMRASSSMMSGGSDPGMVLPPGMTGSSAIEAADTAKGAREVDLLALELDDAVQLAELPPAAPDRALSGMNSGADVNSISSAASAPTAAADPFAASSFTSAVSGPGGSFSGHYGAPPAPAPAGNPFGGPPAPAAALRGGAYPPAQLQVGGDGVDEAAPFSTTPPPGGFSPHPGAYYSPQPSQYSPQQSRGSPSPAAAPSPAAQLNTNVRSSALHDPFAEFNTLRKPPPPTKEQVPSMKAMRASGEGALAAASPMASPLVRGTHNGAGMPPPSPSHSFSAGSAYNYAAPAPSFASAPAGSFGAAGGASFSTAGGASFTSGGFSGAPNGASFTSMGGASFNGPTHTVETGANGTASFAVRFDDLKSSSLL